MYTTMLDSIKSKRTHKLMSDVKLIGNSISLNSEATNYVFS